MSWKILSHVWNEVQDVSSSELFILLTIAEHSKDCGHGWISYSRLAKRTRLSEPTVKRIVKQLIRSGHLHKSKFKTPKGANIYTLLCTYHGDTARLGSCINCNLKGVSLRYRDPKEDPLYISQKSKNGKLEKAEAERIVRDLGINPNSAMYRNMIGE